MQVSFGLAIRITPQAAVRIARALGEYSVDSGIGYRSYYDAMYTGDS